MRVSTFSPKSSSSSARDGSAMMASILVSDMVCKDEDEEDGGEGEGVTRRMDLMRFLEASAAYCTAPAVTAL